MTQPDKLFREKLEAYESPAPLSAWDKIESNLDRKSSNGLWMKIAAGLVLLAIAMFAWYTTNTYHDQADQLVQNKNSVEPTKENSTPVVTESSENNTAQAESIIPEKPVERSSAPAVQSSIKKKSAEQPVLVAQSEPSVESMADPVEVPVIEIDTHTIESTTASTAQVSDASGSDVILYTAEEVNLKFLKKNLDNATSEEKKPSGIQRLITLAADLKNTEGGMGELRERKDDILALNFRRNNEVKNN